MNQWPSVPKRGPIIAELVTALLDDPSAQPRLSLLTDEGDHPLGHILFTRVTISGHEQSVIASLLCPLAVAPDAQSRGIGGALVKAGLERLKQMGVDLVFVLGHPGYYPRFGFIPAGQFGLHAPYPIEKKNAGAWMVQALQPGLLGRIEGKLNCADSLQNPEYWQE